MYWTTAVGLGTVLGIALVVLLFYLRAARARRELLSAVARELGCAFHGDSFRGRYRSRSVRGDAVDAVPRRTEVRAEYRSHGLVVGIVLGAMMAFRAIASALRGSGERLLRLRVELSAHGQPEPDGPNAASAVRKHLRERLGDEARCEVSTCGGTELVLVLRGEAATPEAARRLLELAITESLPLGDQTTARSRRGPATPPEEPRSRGS